MTLPIYRVEWCKTVEEHSGATGDPATFLERVGGVEMSESKKSEGVHVSDEQIAAEWTKIIEAGGFVQEVADALGMEKPKLQARVNILRKYLRDAGVPNEENLPKAKVRTRRKNLSGIAAAVKAAREKAVLAMAEADKADAKATAPAPAVTA